MHAMAFRTKFHFDHLFFQKTGGQDRPDETDSDREWPNAMHVMRGRIRITRTAELRGNVP